MQKEHDIENRCSTDRRTPTDEVQETAPDQDGLVPDQPGQRPHFKRPSLVLNACSNYAGLAANVLTGFILTPIVVAYLGKSGYGMWTLVGSIVGYAGLLDLGVLAAVRRYVARVAAKGEYDIQNQMISSALTLFTIVSAVIILLAALAAEPIGRFLHLEAGQLRDFRNAMWILSLSAVLELIGGVFRASGAAGRPGHGHDTSFGRPR